MDICGYEFDPRSKSPSPGVVAVIEEHRDGTRLVVRAIPTRNMAHALDALDGDPVMRATGPGCSRVTACRRARDYGDARDIAAEVAGTTTYDRRGLGEIGPSGGEIPYWGGYGGFELSPELDRRARERDRGRW